MTIQPQHPLVRSEHEPITSGLVVGRQSFYGLIVSTAITQMYTPRTRQLLRASIYGVGLATLGAGNSQLDLDIAFTDGYGTVTTTPLTLVITTAGGVGRAYSMVVFEAREGYGVSVQARVTDVGAMTKTFTARCVLERLE